MQKYIEKLPILRYWKSFVWACVIAYGLLTPGDKLPKQNLLHFAHADKLLHFLIFFGLEWLVLYESVSRELFPPRFRQRMIISGIVIAYAAGTEILQLLISNKREGDIFDFLADTVGILFALLSYDLTFGFIDRFFLRKK